MKIEKIICYFYQIFSYTTDLSNKFNTQQKYLTLSARLTSQLKKSLRQQPTTIVHTSLQKITNSLLRSSHSEMNNLNCVSSNYFKKLRHV